MDIVTQQPLSDQQQAAADEQAAAAWEQLPGASLQSQPQAQAGRAKPGNVLLQLQGVLAFAAVMPWQQPAGAHMALETLRLGQWHGLSCTTCVLCQPRRLCIASYLPVASKLLMLSAARAAGSVRVAALVQASSMLLITMEDLAEGSPGLAVGIGWLVWLWLQIMLTFGQNIRGRVKDS